jgi:hypothetical protein
VWPSRLSASRVAFDETFRAGRGALLDEEGQGMARPVSAVRRVWTEPKPGALGRRDGRWRRSVVAVGGGGRPIPGVADFREMSGKWQFGPSNAGADGVLTSSRGLLAMSRSNSNGSALLSFSAVMSSIRSSFTVNWGSSSSATASRRHSS